MSIERWKLSYGFNRAGLVDDKKGDWVKYKDHTQDMFEKDMVINHQADTIRQLEMQRNDLNVINQLHRNVVKGLEKEIEKHLDARFVACESHVVTMGKLIEAQEKIKQLEETIMAQHLRQVKTEHKLIDIRCVLLHSGSTSDERMKIDRILEK